MHSNFETILPIWENNLWPRRSSKIEPISWIAPTGEYCKEFNTEVAQFWIISNDINETFGVISGHPTPPYGYRSRGLWVREDLRGKGLGQLLLSTVLRYARTNNFKKVWSMPRQTSWKVYSKAGFKVTGTSDAFEFGPHYFAEFIF